MQPTINKQFGNVTIAGGLLVAVLGLIMWKTAGHLAGLGFVISGSGFNLKSSALAKLGSPQPRLRNIGIAFFALGLVVFAITLAGL